MLSNIISVHYCYDYLIDQIPVGLLLYSHIPTAIIAVLFTIALLFYTRTLQSLTLFMVALFFALWCFFDLGSWFAFLGSNVTMFTWSVGYLFSLLFFAFSYYFLYTYITKRDLPIWQKIVGILVLLPMAVSVFQGANLLSYDANVCEAVENEFATSYLFYSQLAILLATVILSIFQYIKAKNRNQKNEVALASTGVILFLGIFLSASWLASVLVNYDAWAEYAYNFEIYGLFGMPILLGYLGYLIVRYHAFNLKVFMAQALVAVLILVLASEFAFVDTLANQLLVGITLLLTVFAGITLIRSVRREIEQRERIQKLAIELRETNERQESLIHFVSHEVKGFLTKDMGAFAALNEGDLGPLPEPMKPFVKNAFEQSREGTNSVIEILQASNQKKGTVEYKKEPFDFGALVKEWYEKLKPLAEKKGLQMALSIDEAGAPYTVVGDGSQTGDHVLRNLIENSINYTPQGSVNITLAKKDGKAVFTVADTGVGISDEDKKRLFTEGGKGKESLKVNVHSTGYGLFIAKNIVVAEGGTIRAESDGPGKGSRFIIELPAA